MRRRMLRAAVLLLWALFFSYLWVSGNSTRFIGPRTAWVVPFGAIVLTLTAVVQIATMSTRDEEAAAGTGDALGMLLLVAPMIVLLAVPDAGLGSLAASRKSSGEGIAGLTSILPPDDPGRELSFADVYWASESEDYAIKAGISDGLEMRLEGFVTGADAPDGTFSLTRFYVACCAADAVPYSVTVDPRGEGVRAGVHYPDDTWLMVTGRLERAAGEYVLVPETIEEIEAPKDPYLS